MKHRNSTPLPRIAGEAGRWQSRTRHISPYQVMLRLATGLVGGYAFAWGFSALGMSGLVALGVDFDEAQTAVLLLAFLVFLPLFLWSFSSPRQGRVISLLFGGAALMTVFAWAIQRVVLG